MSLKNLCKTNDAVLKVWGLLSEGAEGQNKYDLAAAGANEGHYMERMVHILKTFGYLDQAKLCADIYTFMKGNHKPQWVDAVMVDMSELVVYNAQREGATPEDWSKIVWGLDDSVLSKEGLLKYRTMKAEEIEAETKPAGKLARYGFDLTGFESGQIFKRIIMACGINAKAEHMTDRYIWTGKGIRLVTANNPITGKYGRLGQREDEEGYASYMGVEGDAALVKKFVALVKKYGDVKEYAPGKLPFIGFGTGKKPKPEAEKIEWGFDLTHFEDPNSWEKVLSAVGIPPKGVLQDDGSGTKAWTWEGEGIRIVTGNNPITGEYYKSGMRQPEVGYASYIGIEGDEDKVKTVAKLIKKLGDIKDESPGRRDFI